MRRFLVALSILPALGLHASAVDYEKIDRRIVKEPIYKSGKPKYALLAFGREARLRVWAVLDGGTLHLDRDGNGDLTGKDDFAGDLKNCKDVAIADPDGKTSYVVTGVGLMEDEKPRPRAALMFGVTVRGPTEYRQYCDVELTTDPAKSRTAHFHGPLTAQPVTVDWKLPPGLALKLGEGETDLRLLVGTLDAKAGCWTVVRTHEGDRSLFAEGVRPEVKIEWPAAKNGGTSIVQKVSLKQFC